MDSVATQPAARAAGTQLCCREGGQLPATRSAVWQCFQERVDKHRPPARFGLEPRFTDPSREDEGLSSEGLAWLENGKGWRAGEPALPACLSRRAMTPGLALKMCPRSGSQYLSRNNTAR